MMQRTATASFLWRSLTQNFKPSFATIPTLSDGTLSEKGPSLLLYPTSVVVDASTSPSETIINSRCRSCHLFTSVRHFASQKTKRKSNPFAVLNVSRNTSYDQVKKVFLKIAMKHHPDTSGAKSKKEQDESREIFMKARGAFEAIAEHPEGGVCLVEELPDYEPDEEHDHLDAWFKQETGFDMPYMDEETMREVAEATEKMGGGLDRDGGMWDLAKQVTRAVKHGGHGQSLLRIEAGQVPDEINDVNLRARRRKKR